MAVTAGAGAGKSVGECKTGVYRLCPQDKGAAGRLRDCRHEVLLTAAGKGASGAGAAMAHAHLPIALTPMVVLVAIRPHAWPKRSFWPQPFLPHHVRVRAAHLALRRKTPPPPSLPHGVLVPFPL